MGRAAARYQPVRRMSVELHGRRYRKAVLTAAVARRRRGSARAAEPAENCRTHVARYVIFEGLSHFN